MSSPDRGPRDSGAASAPETGGSADVGREHGHSPRPVSGPDARPQPQPGGAADHKPRHKHHDGDVPASVPVGTPEAPVVPPSQPALKAEAAEADEGRSAEIDVAALTAKAEKADEYLELAQRTKADFENYRKRALREAAAAQDRGVAKLAMELLPAVDNLDRALDAAEAAAPDAAADGASPLVDGIKLVHADVIAALARVGIEPFSPKGEPFDPQHHEAIAQQPVDGAQSGTVVEVYQRGYRLGDTILRPARVVVAA